MSVGSETVASMATILGYARVSTTGQDLDTQLTALTAGGVGADRIYTDKLSGSAKVERPGLAALLDYTRPGDTVVVTAIDRLGRSVAEVTRTITELGQGGHDRGDGPAGGGGGVDPFTQGAQQD